MISTHPVWAAKKKNLICTHKCKVRAQTDTITLKGGVNMKRDKHLGIRMDSQLHKKLVYIAEYEGRSLNWQVIHLIQECVRAFEREHGPIPDEELS